MDKFIKFALTGAIAYYAGSTVDSLVGGGGFRGIAAKVAGAGGGAWLASELL